MLEFEWAMSPTAHSPSPRAAAPNATTTMRHLLHSRRRLRRGGGIPTGHRHHLPLLRPLPGLLRRRTHQIRRLRAAAPWLRRRDLLLLSVPRRRAAQEGRPIRVRAAAGEPARRIQLEVWSGTTRSMPASSSMDMDSGCRTLRPFGSSRSEDSFIQVGLHGTGASLPLVDEQIISMKLVTPAKGTIELSREKDPELFYLARCGLGGVGVIAEVTLRCVERHQLVEHTFVSNAHKVKKNHKKWLSENKHIKYLWIPYTDTAVVFQCNSPSKWRTPKLTSKYEKDEALQHVQDLYCESLEKYRAIFLC